eukprot:CAMPEP_0172881742 /NCGR_PEP_ID=MMETSP1075-20121228/118274_1 /TAXON_ID=2916 /ORGANISM="Ceratium fusus, Strain PA161109" /LENGTH=95 /DNA_ID=CAMNT_0013734271 /DNA_START=610 /DNA_END=894 /DNA_ORIENTATION=-
MVTTPSRFDGVSEVVLTPTLNLSSDLRPWNTPVMSAVFCNQVVEALIIAFHSWYLQNPHCNSPALLIVRVAAVELSLGPGHNVRRQERFTFGNHK